jgi:hypothetical protein
MAASNAFLARLGLEIDADERQVRRAYARELKQIDQERDLEGFQHLRACYEAALHWVAQEADVDTLVPTTCAAQGANDAVPCAPHVGATRFAVDPTGTYGWVDGSDPRALGTDVFADFCARITALAALPERHAHYEARRVAHWSTALREALADPRLIHLEAPSVFEQHVADLLAGGWQPGHHLLFPAAVEVFGWEDDQDALYRLGHAGMVLDAALTQRVMFQHQDIMTRTRQREVLLLLRAPRLPGESKMKRCMGHLLRLIEHFPDTLHILAPQAAVAEWRRRIPEAVPAPSSRTSESHWILELCILLVVAAGIFLTPHGGRGRPNEAERAQQELHSSVDRARFTDAQVDAICARIDYRIDLHKSFGVQVVSMEVTLDSDGNVAAIDRIDHPADPALEVAVEKAIRASAPFPDDRDKTLYISIRAEPVMPKVPAPPSTRPPSDTPSGR